ncbi:MAG TPA: hypothetical protein DCE44_05205, partial [Verrucomicrobiales bacterium]|nr:hypothetical protein [Verrucomicrobiales bacterium]
MGKGQFRDTTEAEHSDRRSQLSLWEQSSAVKLGQQSREPQHSANSVPPAYFRFALRLASSKRLVALWGSTGGADGFSGAATSGDSDSPDTGTTADCFGLKRSADAVSGSTRAAPAPVRVPRVRSRA